MPSPIYSGKPFYPDYMYTRQQIMAGIYVPRWNECWGRWAQAIEDDVANIAEPDLSGKLPIPSAEKVNAFIDGFMSFFNEQLTKDPDYWALKNIDKPPAFNKLNSKARLAFYQDMWAILKDWPIEDV